MSTDQNMGDAELLLKIRNGDRQAFKVLFFQYHVRFCIWAYKITENKQAAEDIVQDFFIQYWNHRERLSFSPSFVSYAYRSIYHSSLNYLRDNERFVYGVEIQEDLLDDYAEEHMKEQETELMNAIEELPDRCREIFVMVTLDKKKHIEVAQYFGISMNTVKVQVSKAYRILRKKCNSSFLLFL